MHRKLRKSSDNQHRKIEIRHGIVSGLRAGYWPEAVVGILERLGLRDPVWPIFDFCNGDRLKSNESPADMVNMLARLNREYCLPKMGRRITTVFLPATAIPSQKLINTIAQARASAIQCVILAKRDFDIKSMPASILHQMVFEIDHDTALDELDSKKTTSMGFWRRRASEKSR